MPDEPRAQIRFHGELADLAARRGRPAAFPYPLTRKASVKDVLEALGVPHTEIYRLVINGQEAGFSYILKAHDQVEAYPGAPPVNPLAPSALRPALSQLRFLVDANVAKLAMLLRILDFDASDAPGGSKGKDADIADLATKEERFVLTRDAALLKRSQISHGRLIRSAMPEEQLLEALWFFGLKPPFRTFKRCLRCNVPLRQVEKKDVLTLLEPKTKAYFDVFHQCPVCQRVYWQGSHHDAMLNRIQEISNKLSHMGDINRTKKIQE